MTEQQRENATAPGTHGELRDRHKQNRFHHLPRVFKPIREYLQGACSVQGLDLTIRLPNKSLLTAGGGERLLEAWAERHAQRSAARGGMGGDGRPLRWAGPSRWDRDLEEQPVPSSGATAAEGQANSLSLLTCMRRVKLVPFSDLVILFTFFCLNEWLLSKPEI